MKTPEEIKFGLTCLWTDSSCKDCGYDENGCIDQVQKDAIQYIKQLEKDLAETNKLLENYRRRFNALKSYITHLADGEHEIKEA